MEFRILGPLEVWHEGQQVKVSGTKQRALLAVLLLNANQVVSSDRLITDLWGEESPDSGGTALRVRLSQLRKALDVEDESNPILTRSPGYLIRIKPAQLDLHRFELLVEDARAAQETGSPKDAATKLRQALDLWQGPALIDFAYEEFAQGAIARLEELRLVALEQRIDADLALGRDSELVGELEALIAEHPLRERPYGQLMVALYRSGRQAEALETYQDARRTLLDELGIEPSPALQDLEKAVLNQDSSLDLSDAGAPAGQPRMPQRAIVVLPRQDSSLDALLALAGPLATRPPRDLILAGLVTDAGDLVTTSALLHEHRAQLVDGGVAARAAAFTTEEPGQEAVRLASEQDADLLLVDAPPGLLELGLPDEELATLLAGAPCDVALLVQRAAGSFALGEGDAILVPFGGAEHEWAAVEIAAWIAGALGASIKLAGVASDPDSETRDASRLLGHASLAVQRMLGIPTDPVLVPAGGEGMLSAAADASLLVMGLSSRWRLEGLGQARLEVAKQARPPILLVKHGLRPGGLAPRESLTRFTWALGR